jgi:hypothetical protein
MKERNIMGDLGLDGRTILKLILMEESVRMWSGLTGTAQG